MTTEKEIKTIKRKAALLLAMIAAMVGVVIAIQVTTSRQTRPADVEKLINERLATTPAQVLAEVSALKTEVETLKKEVQQLKQMIEE